MTNSNNGPHQPAALLKEFSAVSHIAVNSCLMYAAKLRMHFPSYRACQARPGPLLHPLTDRGRAEDLLCLFYLPCLSSPYSINYALLEALSFLLAFLITHVFHVQEALRPASILNQRYALGTISVHTCCKYHSTNPRYHCRIFSVRGPESEVAVLSKG